MTGTTRPSTAGPAGAERDRRMAALYDRALAEARAALDPGRHLLGFPSARDPGRLSYRAPQSLPLAGALLAAGEPAAVAEAAAIVAAVLDTQELAADHPYRGNFRWLADDAEVCDLNAVQFVLQALLPVLLAHGDRLPPALLARCRAAVRLALAEEERLDVAPTYTNIHLMSLFALLVGGEWLDDAHYRALGQARWARWARFTAESGAPHEYNSPVYGAVDLGTLAVLQAVVRDPAVRLQARLFYERLWLHLALHLHRPTGQHAGPHCRSYWGQMMTGQNVMKQIVWRETGWEWTLAAGPFGGQAAPPSDLALAQTPHWLPAAARRWLEAGADVLPHEVRETANRAAGADLTTFLTPTHALGTASRTYTIGQDDYYIEHQANYLLLHYIRPDGWGMMYSRYVVNDRHHGTLAAAPDRSPTSNFYDQGHFAGVQRGNRAIALYALMPQHEEVFSLKTVVVFPRADLLDEVWVGDRRVAAAALPSEAPVGEWVVVADGGVYVGLRALAPSHLGRPLAPRLEWGPAGELWLTIPNYQGAPKRFWDYASLRGAFWRGNLRAGYVVEVAARADYPSAAAFLAHLRRAVVEDTVDADRVRTVTFRGGDDELTLRYDLMRTEPVERRLNGTVYQAPSLASPLAVQGDDGLLAVGGATLRTAPGPRWLIADEIDPARPAWIAVNPLDEPTPLRLETPRGVVTAERWGLGRLEWRAPSDGEQEVLVETLEEPVGLVAPPGVVVRRWSGEGE
jgi:hypothetical protein